MAETELKLATLPPNLVKSIQGGQTKIDSVCASIKSKHPELKLTREQVRDVVAYSIYEAEKDLLAISPNDIGILSKKIDTHLNGEIDRINDESVLLREVCKKDPSAEYMVAGIGTISVEEAKDKLAYNTKVLLEIKKSLNDQKKSEKDTTVNMQVNIGDVISDTLTNIKTLDATV